MAQATASHFLSTAAGCLEGSDAAPGPLSDITEVVRQALQQDVEAIVAEKLEEITREGRAMLMQAQQREQREQERADKLAAEVRLCLTRQQALEAENAHLRQVLHGMASRLSLLGAAFGTPATPWAGGLAACLTASPATTAPTPSPAQRSPSERTPTPLPTPPAAEGDGPPGLGPLPDVPPFPFAASQARAPGAPLSLVQALCQGAAQAGQAPSSASGPTQLSLASSLPTGPAEPTEAAAAPAPGGPREFSFTLRKADGTDLGLGVTQDEDGLVIEEVRDGGAVEAWNRSCAGGGCPDRVVQAGDRIVSVNSVTQSAASMLEECECRQLLRLTIRRDPGEQCRPTMRAEASEFVPVGAPPGMGAAASEPRPAPEDPPDAATSLAAVGGEPLQVQ